RRALTTAGSVVLELGGASGAPPRPPARFAGVNPAPLVLELGGASGAPPRPPARFAEVNSAPLVLELGGASGAPPRPPARFAEVNSAPLAGVAFLLLASACATVPLLPPADVAARDRGAR